MGLKVGTTDVKKIYMGTDYVGCVKVGSDVVWRRTYPLILQADNTSMGSKISRLAGTNTIQCRSSLVDGEGTNYLTLQEGRREYTIEATSNLPYGSTYSFRNDNNASIHPISSIRGTYFEVNGDVDERTVILNDRDWFVHSLPDLSGQMCTYTYSTTSGEYSYTASISVTAKNDMYCELELITQPTDPQEVPKSVTSSSQYLTSGQTKIVKVSGLTSLKLHNKFELCIYSAPTTALLSDNSALRQMVEIIKVFPAPPDTGGNTPLD